MLASVSPISSEYCLNHAVGKYPVFGQVSRRKVKLRVQNRGQKGKKKAFPAVLLAAGRSIPVNFQTKLFKDLFQFQNLFFRQAFFDQRLPGYFAVG